MPRTHPLIQFRAERRVQPTELPANVAARERAEEDRKRRSVEGQRELRRQAEEARKERAHRTAFWTDQHKLILAEITKAEAVRRAALEAADLEAAVEAQVRVSALRDLVEPLRYAARQNLGPAFSPHLMGRA